MADLRKNLRDALRKMSYSTSVDQLRRRGVRQVNVLGLDRVVSLVEQAVYHSLRNRLMGLDRKQVADATKAEFIRLLQTNQKLNKDRQKLETVKRRSEEEVQHLRRELAQQRKTLRTKLDEAASRRNESVENDDIVIIERLETLFGAVASQRHVNLDKLQKKVQDTVLEMVATERHAAVSAREELHSREVDLLQRRIAKVNEALGDTERQLSESMRERPVEDGLASRYREVQGLSPDEANYQRKKELVYEIFRANLALQKGGGS